MAVIVRRTWKRLGEGLQFASCLTKLKAMSDAFHLTVSRSLHTCRALPVEREDQIGLHGT